MYLVERVYLLMQVELYWYITDLTSLHFPGNEMKKDQHEHDHVQYIYIFIRHIQ